MDVGKIKQGKSLTEEEVLKFLDTIVYITRHNINAKLDDFSWKCDEAQSILCHYLNKIGCPNFPCMTQSVITNDIEGHSFVTIMLMVNDEVEVLDENELEEAYQNKLIDIDTYNMAIKTKDILLNEIKNKSNKYLNLDVKELLSEK